MASLRKANTPSPDMQKFLYTILKQLDLKSIEWNQIAEATGITNGHAARMRYSRFKKQMEGHVPQRRQPRKVARPDVKPKKPKDEDDKSLMSIKLERDAALGRGEATYPSMSSTRTPPSTPHTPFVKDEPFDEVATPQYLLPNYHPYQVEQAYMPEPVDALFTTEPDMTTFSEPIPSFDMHDPYFQPRYSSPLPQDNYMQTLSQYEYPEMQSGPSQTYIPSLDMFSAKINDQDGIEGEEAWTSEFDV